MTIQLTKTRDLPPSASEPQGGITNIYNPSTGKDERAPMGQFQNVQNWTAKTYQYSPTIVIYGGKQYILDVAVPFTSSNFSNELDSGTWKEFDGAGDVKVSDTDAAPSNLYNKIELEEDLAKAIVNQGEDEKLKLTFTGKIFNIARDYSTQLTAQATENIPMFLPTRTGTLALIEDLVSNIITLFSPSDETPSGVVSNQSDANKEFTANIKALQADVARLAQASASVVSDPQQQAISTTESTIDISKELEPTDTDIIDVNETLNTIIMKKAGRYQYLSSFVIENNSNNTDHSVTVRTRRLSDNAIITSRVIPISAKTTRTDFRTVPFEVAEGDEPLEIIITLEGSSNVDLTLINFETTLTIGASAGATTDQFVRILDTDAQSGFLDDKLSTGDEFERDILNPTANASLLLTFKGWIYNAARTFYHNIVSTSTANRTATLQDRDGTIAYLDDIPTGGDTFHPDPSIALSDETSDLVPLENDASITLTRAQTFTAFSASVTTAPTDANLNVDVLLNGSVIANITIVAGQTYGTTTTISDTSGVVADVLKFDLTQVGATITGTGLKGYTLSNLV